MYQIKHKLTGEVWIASSNKNIFDKPAHAKAAWYQAYKNSSWVAYKGQPVRFDDNTDYEIVEYIDENLTRLDKAEHLLRKCLGRCEWDIEQEIKEFLK